MRQDACRWQAARAVTASQMVSAVNRDGAVSTPGTGNGRGRVISRTGPVGMPTRLHTLTPLVDGRGCT